MSIEIRHVRGHVIHTLDADSFAGADFRDANLQGADFRGAILHGPNTEIPERAEGAVFYGADLRGADFTAADPRFALFREANLTDAKFELGARLNMCKHTLLAEFFASMPMAILTAWRTLSSSSRTSIGIGLVFGDWPPTSGVGARSAPRHWSNRTMRGYTDA